MKKYCLNYKLLFLMMLPLLCIFVSVCFLLFSYNAGLYVGILILFLSLLTITVLLLVEPVFFIINSQGITLIGTFKKYWVAWKQIDCICVKYDPIFNFLFIKDYVLITDNSFQCPHRFLRIIKCDKTQVLMNRYALFHRINIIK